MLFVHIGGCILVLVAQNKDNSYAGSWVEAYFLKYNITNLEEKYIEIYVATIYWTITTICTVGYGDILAVNEVERIVISIFMIIGVFSFGYLSGNITSLI